MREVNEFFIGDEVLVKYDDGTIQADVYVTITKKWWTNGWQFETPSPEVTDSEQWFYAGEVTRYVGLGSLVDVSPIMHILTSS